MDQINITTYKIYKSNNKNHIISIISKVSWMIPLLIIAILCKNCHQWYIYFRGKDVELMYGIIHVKMGVIIGFWIFSIIFYNFKHSTKMEGPSPRIVKETKTIQTDPVPGIAFSPDPTNYKHFFIELQGRCDIM